MYKLVCFVLDERLKNQLNLLDLGDPEETQAECSIPVELRRQLRVPRQKQLGFTEHERGDSCTGRKLWQYLSGLSQVFQRELICTCVGEVYSKLKNEPLEGPKGTILGAQVKPRIFYFSSSSRRVNSSRGYNIAKYLCK